MVPLSPLLSRYRSVLGVTLPTTIMNFLSSAFSLLSTSSIPYTIKSKIVEPTGNADHIIWTVYDGVNPKNDSAVTIFEFNLKEPATAHYKDLARNCFKKLKLIRIPEVITIIDFIENDNYLYLITEKVLPLTTYLELRQPLAADVKIYGLFKVLNALNFINSKANCVHANLNFTSVWVNELGEWRLFGYELLTNLTSDPDQPLYRLSDNMKSFKNTIPPEVASNGVTALQSNPKLLDSYKLGMFIYQIFATKDFYEIAEPFSETLPAKISGLVDRSGVPKPLIQPVSQLINTRRISIEKFSQDTEKFFSSNRLVEFSQLLEEIKFADNQTKLSFFKHDLEEYINGEFPPGYLDNKLLPDIVEQYNNLVKLKAQLAASPEEQASRQEAMSTILNHILVLSSNLDEKVFNKLVSPVIFQAFSLPDRAVRLSLLKHLANYGPKLNDQDVQLQVFPNLLTGFQDTNFLIRETTLTSLTLIIGKISVKQINNDLLKVLAKLQMDPKPSIRTNTLILIIKISGSIYSNSRNNVMITALAKALRDSFTPCKMAALSGFDKLIDSFGLEEKCTKVLGHIAVALMDPKSHKVRSEAKRVLQRYLDSVEAHAAKFLKDEEDEDAEEKEFMDRVSEAKSSTVKVESSNPPASSFGWGMVNKLVSSEPSSVAGTINPIMNRSTPDVTRINSPAIEEQTWSDDALDEWGSEEIHTTAPPTTQATKIISKPKPAQRKSHSCKRKKLRNLPNLTGLLDRP